eukprot:CAMPEP_0198153698 /NCGR_PEP_ID=MMETSP1443-20131203/65310_1 /TAXON_ID=186043 /ORGANISM="Entomoneis sp., Strain CCMP2396" /LENGTH=528 /DNA_ID=CAMNT_0043820123 /DNA_START=96 /DNA_END=1682 /DNA_ORIENTATION=-
MSWFEATDCPCNSLALNCLQMSCCMPSPAFDGSSELFEAINKAIGDDDGDDIGIGNGIGIGNNKLTAAATWMALLAKLEPEKRFRDLLIVGSHHSASYTIHPNFPFSAIGRCQNLPIVQQLEAGIRLLDLRVGGRRGNQGHSNVMVWHGSLEGQPFIPILQQIDAFAMDHPSEIITINLQPEYGVAFSSDQKLYVLKRIHEMFQGRLVKATDMENVLATWTLQDMQEKKKQVIVLFHPRFCRNFKQQISGTAGLDWSARELEKEFDVINADVWMRYPWFNTRDTDNLFQMVLRDIRTHGNKKRHQFHCSQLVLTPGVGGLGDVVKALVGTNPIRPVSLSQHLYKGQQLNNYLRRNSNEPWNMFLLDFVDHCPWTVRFLTALNFPVKVEICLAAFSDRNHTRTVNVTQAMKQNVCRQNAVFFTNVLEDLGLANDNDDCKKNEGGTLTVAYRLGDLSFHVLTLPIVEKTTSLLISYFATSVESVVTIPMSDSGIIFGDRILSSTVAVHKLKGIVVRFKSTESDCVFDVVG